MVNSLRPPFGTFAGGADTDVLGARKSLWGSLVSKLENELEAEEDGCATVKTSSTSASSVRPSLSRNPAGPCQFGRENLEIPPRRNTSAEIHYIPLRDWIVASRCHCGGGEDSESAEERRVRLERSVRILLSLATKIVGSRGLNEDEEVHVHPEFIAIGNVAVRVSSVAGTGEDIDADFVKCGDSIFCSDEQELCGINKTEKCHAAMDALGRVAYELIAAGDGPNVLEFRSGASDDDAQGGSFSRALSLREEKEARPEDFGDRDDEEGAILDMLRKNPRTTTSEGNDRCYGGILSAMLDAHVPFSLCRFVSDLLMDENDATLGRSEFSFCSFADVLSDLKQMVDNPDAFLHDSSPYRWKLVFGDKLYGRDQNMKAFVGVAEKVAPTGSDPIYEEIFRMKGNSKEVVMVSGNGGAGKSRLVRAGAENLEKKGWVFLSCKFDRVIDPEPLSVIAYAFDKYFGSCITETNAPTPLSVDSKFSSDDPDEIRRRLQQILRPEGLMVLANYIPSLHLFMNIPKLTGSVSDANETTMHALFSRLLRTLSSKRSPILFFVDDLQWADPLSLALLAALVRGARPNPLHGSSAENHKQNSQVDFEEVAKVMFVGSYRDNEIDDDHPLSRVLRNFQSDASVELTNISLSGFSASTLDEMLSGSLHLPVRRVRSLSEIVIKKTDGHPLHVIAFVQALAMDKLMTHSFSRGWEWDADSIDIYPITDSVAELFAFKLLRLPRDILLGLQILSCFGSQVDRNMLGLVSDYDGDNSVDVPAAIRVALGQGILERAARLVSFSHDMLQKAALDSIDDDALVALLRKLTMALIRNASAAGRLDSVLLVIADLINRIGPDAALPEERVLFAELNWRAGSKATAVPDFASAARYAESGIAFLGGDRWETHYDLTLRLCETAVISHFSSLEGDRDRLIERVNEVFEHAKDFSDKFKTHCVWIKMLSLNDISRAIRESLRALEYLGEPLDPTDIDFKMVCAELRRQKEHFSSKQKEKFLSTTRSSDRSKVRAMKVMKSLMVYYFMSKSFLGAYISCYMIGISTKHGHCRESVFGAASFAGSLVNILEDIDEGSAWARIALSLMKSYDEDLLIPTTYPLIYGIVLVWKEPFQSTLEPLARAIRLSLAIGNVEFAMVNTAYYISRSFNSGKNISVLLRELEMLARTFGHDASSDKPKFSPLLHCCMPLYNTLRICQGDMDEEEEEASFPWDKTRIVDNDVTMKAALNTEQFSLFFNILLYQTTKSFVFRDMDKALQYTDMYVELFLNKATRIHFTEIYSIFYEGLITFHFLRQTGKECYKERSDRALLKMREWSKHSDWNFKNKLLVMEAEYYNTQKDFDTASLCYKASINAARDHKFIHEEAIANELAAIFYFERGQYPKSRKFFMQSIECYEKWGAHAVMMRVKDDIRSMKFDSATIEICRGNSSAASDERSKYASLKKRQLEV